MAERRMFAKSVVTSGKFLKLAPTTRLLYFDLGMAADDDGIVEAWPVMKLTGASESDLQILVDKGYCVVLNEDLVVQIMDWKTNNLIKTDRYKPSVYKNIMVKVKGTKAIKMEPKRNPNVSTNGTQMEPQTVERTALVPVVTKRTPKPKAEKQVYGEYQNVFLSDEELFKLQNEFPDWQERIEEVSGYCKQFGRRYKDYLATIRNWARKEAKAIRTFKPASNNLLKALKDFSEVPNGKG